MIEGGSASARSPQLLYAPDEKYPPRPSDQHVPLLDDDDGAGRRSPFRDRVPPASFLATRTRLHPLTLLPAFVFGLLLAMSGIFGTSTFWRAPTDFRLNSYSIGPGNDVRPRHGHLSPLTLSEQAASPDESPPLHLPLVGPHLPPSVVPRSLRPLLVPHAERSSLCARRDTPSHSRPHRERDPHLEREARSPVPDARGRSTRVQTTLPS